MENDMETRSIEWLRLIANITGQRFMNKGRRDDVSTRPVAQTKSSWLRGVT